MRIDESKRIDRKGCGSYARRWMEVTCSSSAVVEELC